MIEQIATRVYLSKGDDKAKWIYFLNTAMWELEEKARGRVLWDTMTVDTEVCSVDEIAFGGRYEEFRDKYMICRVEVEVTE